MCKERARACTTLCAVRAAGPCYRCLFPEAPAPANCARCGEAGVLGVVPGIMGSLQVRMLPVRVPVHKHAGAMAQRTSPSEFYAPGTT